MIDPRAYTINLPDYANTASQGFRQGIQNVAYFQEQEAARQKAAQENEYNIQMKADLADLSNNPTSENYTKYISKYPQLSENLQRGYSTMSDSAKKRAVSTATQGAILLNSGDSEGAKSLFNNISTAYENAGDMNQANATKAIAKLIDADPEMAKASILMIAGQGLDGDQAAEFWGKLGSENRAKQMQPYEVAQAGANIAKTRADTGYTQQQTQTERQNTAIKQAEANTADDYFSLRNEEKGAQIDKIRADQRLDQLRYELDSDKLDADLEWRYEELDRKGRTLDESGQKQVNDAVLESTTLATIAQQQRDLANKARNSGQAGGLVSAGWEGLKNSLGIETERSDMVREVTKMINSEVIKGLPPGPATDKDIELIRKGFPPATADGKTIARFLDSMARVNMAGAANKQMQAEWQSQNGNLGNSKGDLDIMGIRVPKGTTYQKFASANMGKAIKQLDKMNSQQSISRGTASYLKYGQ